VISEIPPKTVFLSLSLNEAGRQAWESVLLLRGICASYRMRIFYWESRAAAVPIAMTLQPRNWGTVRYADGKLREAREIANSASDVTKSNKNYIRHLLRFVQALVTNSYYAITTKFLYRPFRLYLNSCWRKEYLTHVNRVQDARNTTSQGLGDARLVPNNEISIAGDSNRRNY